MGISEYEERCSFISSPPSTSVISAVIVFSSNVISGIEETEVEVVVVDVDVVDEDDEDVISIFFSSVSSLEIVPVVTTGIEGVGMDVGSSSGLGVSVLIEVDEVFSERIYFLMEDISL